MTDKSAAIADLKANEIELELFQHTSSSSSDTATSAPLTLQTVLDSNLAEYTILVMVRRPGCPACREQVMDLVQAIQSSAIASSSPAVQIHLILKPLPSPPDHVNQHKHEEQKDRKLQSYEDYENILADTVELQHNYFSPSSSASQSPSMIGQIYFDTNLKLFKFLTNGRLRHRNLFKAMLSLRVMAGLKRALFDRGVKSGSLKGDATVFGGILILKHIEKANDNGNIDNDGVEVVFKYNEVLGELCPRGDLLRAIRVSDGAVVVDRNEREQVVCESDKCAL